MKVELMKHQVPAVESVLKQLQWARKLWHEENEKTAFALTAVTGAGKTVMAAAVIEHLFHGDATCEFEHDPGAVVIWFSDDPSLNAQSLHRLNQCSEKLSYNNMRVVDGRFDQMILSPRNVYFLNRQKLSKNSRLTRGHSDEGAAHTGSQFMPDNRSYTIWQTIHETVKDKNLTLYLILDEAHRGMGRNSKNNGDKSQDSIVLRLMNGHSSESVSTIYHGVPIVLGISATVDRFTNAVKHDQERTLIKAVKVDAEDVRESGLIKDTILLEMPDKSGPFDTVLVRRGAEKLMARTLAWHAYLRESGIDDDVVPLMVLQVSDKPSTKSIEQSLEVIFETYKDLPVSSVAHVFHNHEEIDFGRYRIRYIKPEDVQRNTSIRVLIAKHAINAGWDCPRAEVMVSFRRATDRTHIEQLLGRLMRSPLARSIDGRDDLNSVDCILPYFDKAGVAAIVESLTSGENSETLPVQRVLTQHDEFYRNPNIENDVFEKFETLPTYVIKSKPMHPVDGLMRLAHALETDQLYDGSVVWAEMELNGILDGLCKRYSKKFQNAIDDVSVVEGTSHTISSSGKQIDAENFSLQSDSNVIDGMYRLSVRKITRGLATKYGEHLSRGKNSPDTTLSSRSYVSARVKIAAIGRVEEIVVGLKQEANKISNSLFDRFSDGIENQNDHRKRTYTEIWNGCGIRLYESLSFPKTNIDEIVGRDGAKYPCVSNHLLCNSSGFYPNSFNGLEKRVIERELEQKYFVGWYRSPGKPVAHSLGIPFSDDGKRKITRPDFIFFSRNTEGKVLASIIDPHSTHLSDFLYKAKGMASYADLHGSNYSRILIILESTRDGRLVDLSIDVNDARVREIVLSAKNQSDILGDDCARTYLERQ